MSELASPFAAHVASALPQASPAQRALLERYLEIVESYRRVLNLTAFKGPAEQAEELVAESARLLSFGPLAHGLRCVDLGSGVGSPVVTLAVLCPQASFIAIEARVKRATFLRQVVASLQLANLSVLAERAEEPCRREPHSFDLVTARAFAKPPPLLDYALKLLQPGGELRAFYGPDISEVEQAAAAAGLVLSGIEAYEHNGLLRHAYFARRAI